MKRIYLTEEESNLIALTPPKECWICDLFYDNVYKNRKGLFIPRRIFQDYGLIEHLHQIVKREIIFNS